MRLRRVVPAGGADVLVKLESVNPTGSYKDRMALAMIEGAEARGLLRPGMRVVEFTGGSTGSSLAMVCAAKGYRFVVLSSDAFAREKLLTMEALGAELRMVPSDGGKVTPALFERFKEEIAVLANEPDTFWTDQFHNEDAVTRLHGHRSRAVATDRRKDRRVLRRGRHRRDVARRVPRAAGRRQSRTHRRTRALVVARPDAKDGAALTGSRGSAPAACRRTWPIGRTTRRVRVDEADARAMAKQLAREEGLLVGTSSGLNIAAAVQLARELGPGKTVATVAVDTGLKYLAGDLFSG